MKSTGNRCGGALLLVGYIVVVCVLGGLAAGAVAARVGGESAGGGPGPVQIAVSLGTAALGGFCAVPAISVIRRIDGRLLGRPRWPLKRNGHQPL